MEGGAATAMEVLIKSLINISKEEISLIRGLDEDAKQLQMSLQTIQGYLNDAEKKYITQNTVKAWLQELEAVAFEADNVLDELSYHALRKKVKHMKTMTDRALSCSSSFDHIVRPSKMARKIKEINSSLDSINKGATDLQLQSMLVDAPTTVSVAAFETDSLTDDPIFIGRDDDVPKLVKVMTGSPDRKISILAIVGMGGMGKTTLTRKVFHHEKMKTQFGCQCWVYVSQTFDPLNIFKNFLALLLPQTVEPTGTGSREAISLKLQKSFKAKTDELIGTREGILKRLQEALKDKTYLLVLDDVWNQDLLKWTDFIDSLSGATSTKGNGIIITTRSTEVVSVVNPLETHHLNGLSNEDCWSVIKAKAFDTRNVIPLEFETIGTKIARRCQGLPLAAKVVGGVLRGKSEQEWFSIEKKWLSDVEGDYISRILRLSYDNLSSSSLKKCFTYCTIFPKGHRTVRQELVELWMAEGFLQSEGGNDMESVGDKFVNILLKNSLLQLAPRNDDEDEDVCVMHDLVHDLASSVLGSLKVRYMRHDDELRHIPKDSEKYLRTLFLQGNTSEFKLSHFKCLHALSLGKNQKLLSGSIGKLVHLRRLDISETQIRYLPDSIGDLHHLNTLRANTSSLRKLPSTLKYLIRLRHLCIPYVKLFPGIGRLTSLRTLTHFTVRNKNGCRIEELGSLTNLKGELMIYNLEKVKGKEEAKKANIFKIPNLLGLGFDWDDDRKRGEIHDENVLEGLQPHPNLKKLYIAGFRGNRFPVWTLKMAVREEPRGTWVCLKMLVEITLSNCIECEEIPTLGHLPNLKSLYLRKLENLKYIKSSFYGMDNNGVCQETMIVFPMLERLMLDHMPNLREWAEVEFAETRPHEVKVFPCLEYLRVSNCIQLMSIPSHLFPCLTELNLFNLNRLECIPELLFYRNQNLSNLSIGQCHKLRELPDGMQTLNSLVKLSIHNCSNLKSIGSSIDIAGQSQATSLSLTVLYIAKLSELECLPNWLFHKSQNLSELAIVDCPNLKSIENPTGNGGQTQGALRELRIKNCERLIDLPHEIFDSWEPSLEKVCLVNLRSLKNLPKVLECLANSCCLKELKIEGVPKFMVAGSVTSWPFGNLRELVIDASVEWSMENSAATKDTVDGILKGCSHSLKSLELGGLEIWESLPESIQNLTSLYDLGLFNFGIEEFPERFGNLSSLKELYLSKCTKLRRLSRSLTKLNFLYIDDCPALHIDSMWLCNNTSIRIQVNDSRYGPISYKCNRCLKLSCSRLRTGTSM